MPSRGDESMGPLHFADDDDPDEIGGFTRGKRSYDDDEDEDGGGWAINEDHSDRLWDSAEEVDDEDADEEGVTVEEDDTEEEEEEADLFGASPIRGRRGRPKGSGKKTEEPSIFAGSANVFGEPAGGAAIAARGANAAGSQGSREPASAKSVTGPRGSSTAGLVSPAHKEVQAAAKAPKKAAAKMVTSSPRAGGGGKSSKKRPTAGKAGAVKSPARKSGARKRASPSKRGSSRAKPAKRPARRGGSSPRKAGKRRTGRR